MNERASFQIDASIAHRDLRRFALQVGLAGGGTLVLAHIGLTEHAIVLAVSVAAVLGGEWRSRMFMRWRPAKLRVDNVGLWIDGVLRVARGGARKASVEVPLTPTDTVSLFIIGVRGELLVVVDTLAEAEDIAESLGVRVSARPPTYPIIDTVLRSVAAWTPLTATIAALLSVSWWGPPPSTGGIVVVGVVAAAAWCVAVAAHVVMLGSARVTIGGDGILVHRLGSSMYIPYAEVLEVQMKSEENIVLLLSDHRLRRIRSCPGTRCTAKLLAAYEWIRARDVTGDVQPANPEENDARNWRMLENPSEVPDARRAAAILLAKGADSHESVRLFRAAQTIAEPKLHLFVERLALAGYPYGDGRRV